MQRSSDRQLLCDAVLTQLVCHPACLAQNLMHAGYEPYSPKALYVSEDGRPWLLFYPNQLVYLYHIWKEDGSLGWYRGLPEQMLTSFTDSYVCTKMYDFLAVPHCCSCKTTKPRTWIVVLMLKALARSTAVVLSQPFHVIAVRKMLQFVGKETTYRRLWTAVPEIYRSQGLGGFFMGLAPRLLSDLAPWLIATLLRKALRGFSAWVRGCTSESPSEGIEDSDEDQSSLCYLARLACNPLYIMSTVMAARGCGLAAARLPNMAHCQGFRSCLMDLIRRKRMLDGGTVFWRYCSNL